MKDIEKEVSIISEFTPEDHGGFTVTCKVVEHNQVIFEISTFAHSREQAKSITDNWKENAISLYPQFIKLLTKPNQE